MSNNRTICSLGIKNDYLKKINSVNNNIKPSLFDSSSKNNHTGNSNASFYLRLTLRKENTII